MALRKTKRRPILKGDPDYEQKLAKCIEEDMEKAYIIEGLRNEKIKNDSLQKTIGNEDEMAEHKEYEEELETQDETNPTQTTEVVGEETETTEEPDLNQDQEVKKDIDQNIEIIDTAGLVPSEAKANNSGKSGSSSSFKIINTTNSGKRLVIKEDITSYLQSTEIEIGFDKDSMILAAKGIGIGTSYSLRENKKNYVIYNSELVTEITRHFMLDFRETTTLGLQVTKAATADGIQLIKLTK